MRDIIVQVTSNCPHNCRYCCIKDWKKEKPDYEFSLDQLNRLLSAIKISGYKVKLYFSGAEPLTWKYLSEAIDTVYEFQIPLIIYTAGIGAEEIIREKADKVEKWIITLYSWNKDEVLNYKKYRNVEINRTEHKKIISEGKNPLPAECACPEYSVEGDYIYNCHGIRQIENSYPFQKIKIQPHFADHLSVLSYNMDICKACISNKNLIFEKHNI